jgi:hypothetical protein
MRRVCDPLNFVDDLAALPQPDIEKIMGGNMMKLFEVEQRVTA